MHVHTTVTYKQNKCNSVGKDIVHKVSIVKWMMYTMMLMLGCVVSSAGIGVGLGTSMCGSVCSDVGRRSIEAVGFGFTPSNQTVGSVVNTEGKEVAVFVYLGKTTSSKVTPPKAKLSGRIVDGGCSWHLCGDPNSFVGELRECKRRRVYGFNSNGDSLTTNLMGDIEFEGMKNLN